MLIVLGVLAVAALFIVNFSSYLPIPGIAKSFSKDEVRGMAVEHDRSLFTLNFEQQNQAIDFLNQASVAKEQSPAKSAIPIQKIIIYPFGNQQPIEIATIAFDNADNLLFRYKDKVMQDTSKGKFKQLLSETYDH